MSVARAAMLALAVVACRGPLAAGQHDTSPEPVSLARLNGAGTAYSSYAGIDDAMRTVIRDSTAWRRLWQRINRPFIPQPMLPDIDFEREMVVVAALGARPSAGYDVVIEGATRDSTGIAVAVRVASPAAGCPVAAVETQPVDLARIPASDRPVRFREREVVVGCGSR